MARRSIVGSIKNKGAIGKCEETSTIAQLFVLSTIFGTMVLGSAKPLGLPEHKPITQPELKQTSHFVEAIYDLWHSIFSWTFLMLVITPKPNVRMINEHRQRQSAATDGNGFSSQCARLFITVRGFFSAIAEGASAILRSPFTSKSKPNSKSQPSVLPQHTSPIPRTDISLDQTFASSTTLRAPSTPNNTIQAPIQASLPNNHVPKPDPPISPKTSPATARFLATLTDLEAQMSNHQFYDLERELEEVDKEMAQMFDFSWMPRKPTESPIPVVLPQAPPPARRDGKTIQILPMICEVSENSPDLAHTPPYDPRRWSIVTFQPLWGPRAQAGTAY